MNFALAFAQTLPLRPLRALAALYWYVTGRKMRARNRLRIAASQTFLAYRQWIWQVERLSHVAATAQETADTWQYKPSFSVVLSVPQGAGEREVTASILSLQQQYHAPLELIISTSNASLTHRVTCEDFPIRTVCKANDGDALAGAIQDARGDYIVPVQAGDRLSPAALFRYGEALQQERAAVLFGDEDAFNRAGGRSRPWFKPQWNAEMFLAQDYITSACTLDTARVKDALVTLSETVPPSFYALVLKLADASPSGVVHVPHIVTHRFPQASPVTSAGARMAALSDHLHDTGAELTAVEDGSIHVRWPLPVSLPKVSIIIPTRDRIDLLRPCVAGVLSATDHENLEVIIVDNGSTERQTLTYLDQIGQDPRVEVIRYPRAYNYSAINNLAAKQATGEYLCLLNNDTEIIQPDWLTELMRHAARPHVGAVGAKLLYPDGSIQHAGVVVGLGNAAGHAHRFLRRGKSGYFNRAHISHYVSAVTAACLVVEKRKYDAVGGLDEEGLAIAFNDVDLCLKLEAAGWKNVYTPHAILIHHESKSRGKDISPEHIDRYRRELAVLQKRWNTENIIDPLHHPNLDRAQENFTIGL